MLHLVEAIHKVPFWTRAMALVCAFALVGAVELAFRRERAERWKEYFAWVTFAAVGAMFGAANDLITSALSPAYFVIGKGLTQGPELAWAAADLGASAGAAAGLLIGGILLMTNNPRGGVPRLRYRRLGLLGFVPLATAAIGAPVFALGSTFDLQGLGPELARVLPEAEVHTFLLVQRSHFGAYVGALAGTLGAAVLVQARATRAFSREFVGEAQLIRCADSRATLPQPAAIGGRFVETLRNGRAVFNAVV